MHPFGSVCTENGRVIVLIYVVWQRETQQVSVLLSLIILMRCISAQLLQDYTDIVIAPHNSVYIIVHLLSKEDVLDLIQDIISERLNLDTLFTNLQNRFSCLRNLV